MKRSKNIRILSARDIKTNLERMAHAILRQNKSLDSLAFIGSRTRGVFLARRLCQIIKNFNGKEIPLGEMDITLYRDDLNALSPHGKVDHTQISFDINNKTIMLFDDVDRFGGSAFTAADMQDLSATLAYMEKKGLLKAKLDLEKNIDQDFGKKADAKAGNK